MRSGLEILKMWDDLDIDYKRKHLIFYSGNGWRASEVMYYAELMGLHRVSMYDGGWYDWSTKFGKLDKVDESFDLGNLTELVRNTTESNVTMKTTTASSTMRPVSGAVGVSVSMKLFQLVLVAAFYMKI